MLYFGHSRLLTAAPKEKSPAGEGGAKGEVVDTVRILAGGALHGIKKKSPVGEGGASLGCVNKK